MRTYKYDGLTKKEYEEKKSGKVDWATFSELVKTANSVSTIDWDSGDSREAFLEDYMTVLDEDGVLPSRARKWNFKGLLKQY